MKTSDFKQLRIWSAEQYGIPSQDPLRSSIIHYRLSASTATILQWVQAFPKIPAGVWTLGPRQEVTVLDPLRKKDGGEDFPAEKASGKIQTLIRFAAKTEEALERAGVHLQDLPLCGTLSMRWEWENTLTAGDVAELHRLVFIETDDPIKHWPIALRELVDRLFAVCWERFPWFSKLPEIRQFQRRRHLRRLADALLQLEEASSFSVPRKAWEGISSDEAELLEIENEIRLDVYNILNALRSDE